MLYLPLPAEQATPIDNTFIENVALAIGLEAFEQAFFPGVVQAEIAQIMTDWIGDNMRTARPTAPYKPGKSVFEALR